MTNKPILQVEIDDSAYRAFQARVGEFQQDVERMPEAWKATDAQVATIQKRFEEMSAAAKAAEGSSGRTRDDSQKTSEFAEVMLGTWSASYGVVRGFSRHVVSATRQIASWERTTALLGGLLGAGGLFGLASIMRAGAGRRYDANSVGVSAGELASFRTNFGRLGNADGILQGFGGAAADVRAQQPLYSLGVDPRGKDAAALFAEALPRVKALVDEARRRDPRNYMGALGAYHLDQLGISRETLQLIGSLPESEIREMLRSYRGDRGGLAVDDRTGRAWQDLETALTRAQVQFQKALAGSLVNVTPGLTRLSEGFVGLVDKLLAEENVGPFLKTVGDGISRFATTIGSEAAQKTFHDFLQHLVLARGDVELLGRRFADVKGFLGLGQETKGPAAGRVLGPSDPGYTSEPYIDEHGKLVKPSSVSEKGAGGKLGGVAGVRAAAAGTPTQPYGGDAPELKPTAGRAPDTEHVDSRLREIMAAAATHLPEGYKVTVNEGYNPSGHTAGSQHHVAGRGALDLVITDPDGNKIPNRGDDPTGMYTRLARGAKGEQQKRYPDLTGRFAWGGAFGTVSGGTTSDLMHFDLGGERGHIKERLLSNMTPLNVREKFDKARAEAGQKAPLDPSQKTLGAMIRNSRAAAQDEAQDPAGGAKLDLGSFKRDLPGLGAGAGIRLAPHPNARATAPPAIVVEDRTGGAAHAEVEHH